MKEILRCPICKSGQCKKIFKREIKPPEGSLELNLANIDFVRNYILFNKILPNKTSIEFYFKICTNCGLIFFTPRCEKKDMILKYKLVNKWHDSDIQDYVRYSTSETYEDKRAFEMYKTLNNIREIRNSNIADIGGLEGYNLKYFLENNQCFVVDYTRRKLINGAKYLCETVQDIPDTMHFAVVLYCHILEHVVDPVGEITRIKEILEPNGLFYIEVPLGCWEEYKRTKNFLTHINFFSEGSLWHLLDACGLNIRYLKTKPTLTHSGYSSRVIVAIAEKSPPHNKKVSGYLITRKQMQNSYFFLRLYADLLNFRLMRTKTKVKYLLKIPLKVIYYLKGVIHTILI